MKAGALICLLLFVVAALLGLAQLWVAPFASGAFVKMMVTLGVLFVVVLAVTLVKHEYLTDKRQRDRGYLD